MFQCGERVMYGIHGVCTILCLEDRVIDRKKVAYYVLEPLSQLGARFYVPVHNEAAVAKMRPVLSKEDLEAILNSPESHADTRIVDENLRKQRYKELIGSGDRIALISMVRTLCKQRNQCMEEGKKFHLCDDNFLRDAKKLLSTEISLVFCLDGEQLNEYLRQVLENEL